MFQERVPSPTRAKDASTSSPPPQQQDAEGIQKLAQKMQALENMLAAVNRSLGDEGFDEAALEQLDRRSAEQVPAGEEDAHGL